MLNAQRAIVGVAAAVLVALVIGVPTGIVQTDWYTRMTPVTWWSYPVWAVSAILTGALAATYVGPRTTTGAEQGGKTLGANMLTTLAVGCPVCNKLVVIVLGVNGALSWFAPAQPILAVVSLALLAYALRVRVKGFSQCAMSPDGSMTRTG